MEPTEETPDKTAKVDPAARAMTLADEVAQVYRRLRQEDDDPDDRKHLWSQAVVLVSMTRQNNFIW